MIEQIELFPERQFSEASALREFIQSGNAKFTIRSEKTLRHYTYKVRKNKDSDIWYVHRLIANGKYLYLGTIFSDHSFTATRKTDNWVREDLGYIGFKWGWEKLVKGQWPPNITIYHEGRCGMCGIQLTDPISVKEGYGPECRKKRLRHEATDVRVTS